MGKYDYIVEHSMEPERMQATRDSYNYTEGAGGGTVSKEDVEDLFKGSIDVHVHADPDPLVDNHWDQLDISLRACKEGMGGIIFKSMTLPSCGATQAVQKAVDMYAEANDLERFRVFGNVVLNDYVGGINPKMVEMCLKAGASLISMPTHDARNHHIVMDWPGGIEVITPDGELLPEVRTVMEMVKEYDVILDSGHIGTREKYIMVEEAKKMGIDKIIINHPNGGVTNTSIDQMVELAQMGGYLGMYMYGAVPCWNNYRFVKPYELLEVIKRAGPERVLISTDYGTQSNPHPVEGMRMFIRLLLIAGIPKADIEIMVKKNARYLLNLDK